MEYKQIGYIYPFYPEKRCIIGKTQNVYKYYNIRKNIDFVLKSLLTKVNLYDVWDKQSMVRLPSGFCDIYHTFNQIVFSRTPSIISFESVVPRNSFTIDREWEWKDDYRNPDDKTIAQIDYLASENVKKLIAISKSAYDLQLHMLNQFKIEEVKIQKIIKKMVVVHPPQSINITEEEIKQKFSNITNEIKFIFVGNFFFSKGGKMVIDALKSFVGRYKFHLTVVSALKSNKICGTVQDEERYQEIMNESSWITHYKHLDNHDVLQLMAESHIGFLPTIQDIYGYSVLEMQASGVPVISSSIRALTEINNNDSGWIINVDTNQVGKEAKYHHKDSKEKLIRDIMHGLVRYLNEIFESVETRQIDYIQNKALNSMKRIQKEHSPEKYGEIINSLYWE